MVAKLRSLFILGGGLLRDARGLEAPETSVEDPAAGGRGPPFTAICRNRNK